MLWVSMKTEAESPVFCTLVDFCELWSWLDFGLEDFVSNNIPLYIVQPWCVFCCAALPWLLFLAYIRDFQEYQLAWFCSFKLVLGSRWLNLCLLPFSHIILLSNYSLLLVNIPHFHSVYLLLLFWLSNFSHFHLLVPVSPPLSFLWMFPSSSHFPPTSILSLLLPCLPSLLSFSDSTHCSLRVYFCSLSSSPHASITSPRFSLSVSLSSCFCLCLYTFYSRTCPTHMRMCEHVHPLRHLHQNEYRCRFLKVLHPHTSHFV